jgi:hypothetical protein
MLKYVILQLDSANSRELIHNSVYDSFTFTEFVKESLMIETINMGTKFCLIFETPVPQSESKAAFAPRDRNRRYKQQ